MGRARHGIDAAAPKGFGRRRALALLILVAAALALALTACGPEPSSWRWQSPAAEPKHPSAILVSPLHDAQVVRGDDGMDHVEYGLLVVSVFAEPVTLSSVTVLDPGGKELMRIDGDALAAATQTLFAKTPTPVIPASAAVSVDVDLILPPDTVPERVTHRITYTLAADPATR